MKCLGTTQRGRRCSNNVISGSRYCHLHFKCAWQTKSGPGKRRCKRECEHCNSLGR